MGYQGEDKWEVYIPRFSEYAPNMKVLKEKIKKHLRTCEPNCMRNQIDSEEYEITNVVLTIKKKRNKISKGE